MNHEYWLIEDDMQGIYNNKNEALNPSIKLIDSFRAKNIKEAEKEFRRRNTLNPKHQYVITKSERWLN